MPMMVVLTIMEGWGHLMDCGDKSSLLPTYHSHTGIVVWQFVAFCFHLKAQLFNLQEYLSN